MKSLFAALLLLGSVASFANCEVTDAEEAAINATVDHFVGGNVVKEIQGKPFKRLAVESKKGFEIVQLHDISYKAGGEGILIVLTKVDAKTCAVTDQVYSERYTK